MPFRIACDLDGTVADLNAALRREAECLFDLAPTSKLTRRQHGRLWEHVRECDNFWETLPETEPGAIARLSSIAIGRGWEVIFLTQRPRTAGHAVQLQSQRWLRACGFDLPSVFVVAGSRGKAAAALSLDAVIDDRPENCLDVSVESNAVPLLLWRDAPERLPPGISRVRTQVVATMGEAIDHLIRLQTQVSAPRGFLSHLRQALHPSVGQGLP